MNPNGSIHRHANSALGVADREPVETQDPFGQSFITFDNEEKKGTDLKEQRPDRKRHRFIGASIFLLVLIVGGTGLWIMFGSSGRKINLQVRDNAHQTEQNSPDPESVTAQAIAEIRGATAAPTPAPGISSTTGTTGITGATGTIGATGTTETTRTILLPGTPVTVPPEGAGNAASSPAAEASAGGQGHGSLAHAGGAVRLGHAISARNPERSIRCAPLPLAISVRQPSPESSPREPAINFPIALKKPERMVTLPSFGAMLPVRTLGAIYTLRSSLTRFELLRDIEGPGWRMRKGTLLVGQQQGSEYDRAYVSLTGFIDPETKRFVKVTGEVLGADGAPGLKGKRRQINSRWTRVLGRAATGAVSLGQAALARGNSTTIVLPGAVAPELSLNSSVTGRREFVEVGAGAPAFVMITDLPKEAPGIDAEPGVESGENVLTDGELAELLSSGSPEQIRAAMPRMSPELRRIAEAVVKEPGK